MSIYKFVINGILLIVGYVPLSATELIDLKFTVLYNDGRIGGNIGVIISIREKNEAAFGMGTSRLIFEYNDNALTKPKIIESYAFNEFPNYDSILFEQNANLICLGIDYIGDGNSGVIVADWTNIVLVDFQIMDSTAFTHFNWEPENIYVTINDPNGDYYAGMGDLENCDYHLDQEIIGPKAPEGLVWLRTGGPSGGIGYDVRIHPTDKNIMFITDNPSGVNKSTDGGRSWVQSNKGISVDRNRFGDGAPIFTLSFDPTNPNILWCGTQELKGIYKSFDCGKSWEKKIDGIIENDEISFRGFAVHPMNSNIVLAAAEINSFETDPAMGIKTKGKIYKTINGGNNWYQVWAGDNLARVLIYDYKNPEIIFCSTGIFDRGAFNCNYLTKDVGGVGILKSTDGGENWFTINNGLDHLYVGFLEMHPTNPQILYAAVTQGSGRSTPYNLNYYGGVYKTLNGGINWEKVLNCDEEIEVVTISKSNPDIVYAGNSNSFHKSMDGGKNWERYDRGDANIGYGPIGMSVGIPISAVVDPDNSDKVFINSYQGGNFETNDGGKSWKNSSKGYTGANLRDIAVSNNNSNVYALGRSGIFYSINGGGTWKGLGFGPTSGNADWNKIVVDKLNTNIIYATKDAIGIIYKSIDGGSSWEVVFTHPLADGSSIDRRQSFKSFEIAPSSPNILFAGMANYSGGSVDPLHDYSYGMYKSINNGTTWKSINNGLESTLQSINSIVIHPRNPNIVYIGTLDDGIYKSLDGGETWVRKCNGLSFSNVMSLAIRPDSTNIILAGSGDGKGIFVSRDEGESWHDLNCGIDPVCPSYLGIVGNSNEGFDISWSQNSYSTTFPNWTKITDIVINPIEPNKIYISDLNKGVFASEDNGKSWWNISSGLSIKSVTSLAIAPDGKILYAGTAGAGAHRLALDKDIPYVVTKIFPMNIDTIITYKPDTLTFLIEAHDLNNDTIFYTWIIENETADKGTNSSYSFFSGSFNTGYYDIKVIINDKDSSQIISWVLHVKESQMNAIDYIIDDQEIIIYPNPTNDILFIKTNEDINSEVRISLFDNEGKLLYSKKYNGLIHNEINEFNISGYNKGVYLLQINNSNLFKVNKLIKY